MLLLVESGVIYMFVFVRPFASQGESPLAFSDSLYECQAVQVIMSVPSVNDGIESQPALALALTIYQYCLSLIVVRPRLSSPRRAAHPRTDRRITGHLPYRHRRARQLEALPALQLGDPEQHRARWDQVQEHDRHEHLHDGKHALQRRLECDDRGGVTQCTSADNRGFVRDVAHVERRQDRRRDRRGLD